MYNFIFIICNNIVDINLFKWALRFFYLLMWFFDVENGRRKMRKPMHF